MSEPKITDSKNIFITYNVVKRVINKYVKEDLIPVLDTIKNRKRSIANYEQAIIQLNNKLKSYRKWSFFTKRKRYDTEKTIANYTAIISNQNSNINMENRAVSSILKDIKQQKEIFKEATGISYDEYDKMQSSIMEKEDNNTRGVR